MKRQSIPAQVMTYIAYFCACSNSEETVNCKYNENTDTLELTITSKSMHISIPIHKASTNCLEISAVDFQNHIINTILSVFSRYNACEDTLENYEEIE